MALTTTLLPNWEDIRPYALIALGLGTAWLLASAVWFWRRHSLEWLLLLLLGHWLGLAAAWGTAELGNVNPEMKALLIRGDIQPVLQAETIGLSPGIDSKRSTLLRFYTPQIGKKLTSLDMVYPDDYLWIEENELSAVGVPYESLGQIKTTHLIRLRSQ